MPLLSRDQILSSKLPHLDVEVPEWGGTIRVQQMSSGVREAFLEALRENRQALAAYEEDQAIPAEERANLAKPAELDHALYAISLSVVDELGAPLFTASDLAAFAGLSHNSLTRVWEAVESVNAYRSSPTAQLQSEKKG